jgi:uncharacterized protein (TIGR02118 family)
MVCYLQPDDPAAFDTYYRSTHAPLAEKIPGLESFTWRRCASLDGSQPPYYLLAELAFASQDALMAGLTTPEGQAAAGDVANFTTKPPLMFIQHD